MTATTPEMPEDQPFLQSLSWFDAHWRELTAALLSDLDATSS